MSNKLYDQDFVKIRREALENDTFFQEKFFQANWSNQIFNDVTKPQKKCVEMLKKIFEKYSLNQVRRKHRKSVDKNLLARMDTIMLFYPMDFNYITPSEILAIDSIKDDLNWLDGCRTDGAVVHRKNISVAPEDDGEV